MAAELASPIARALNDVKNKIAQIVSEKSLSQEVRLVAVSKTFPAEAVQEAYDAGHRHFGENYVQELLDKWDKLPSDIKWHMIGHLQSNKCKSIIQVPNLWVVESVDSEKLASKLDAACSSVGRESLNVFVQVNTSGEDSKSGCEPAECVPLVRHVLNQCPRLKFMGLMTIGRLADTPQPDCFQLLSDCRRQVCEQLQLDPANVELSMGMSGDYNIALEMGSTNVRVGSSIFGHRTYPAKQ
eukprot:GILI01031790.1.p1 GENE.GILI01031790.1~~GILI01031790.1.p1  ORF type:complete len:268 (+),score=45.49 GILI01031790.1:82-804(+)